MTISLCMIVKNEELVLARCLDCIKDVVDEIIIVDTGSKDSTVEIAKRYADKVFFYKWDNDFAAARNFSFSKGTMDYLMWMDADDVILEEDKNKLIELKNKKDGLADVYTFDYVVDSDENYNIFQINPRKKLFKREKNYKWYGKVYEYVDIEDGKNEYIDIKFYHKKIRVNEPGRNVNILKEMIEKGEELTDRERKLYAYSLQMDGLYEEAINEYKKFLSEAKDRLDDFVYYQIICEMAESYRKLNKYQESFDIIMEYLNNKRAYARILYELGEYFIHNKKYEEALELNFRIIQGNKYNSLYDEIDSYKKYLPYISIGECYYYLGDIDKAIEYNNKALEYMPHSEYANWRKELYLKEKNK